VGDFIVLVGAVLAATVRNAVPLVFAAMGGLFSERSGVVNIALEGMMLIGAFAGVVGAYFTGSAWIGLLFALGAGLLTALVHAVMCITFEADQIISGTAINLLALGGTGFLMVEIFGSGGTSPRINGFGTLPNLVDGTPLFGPTFRALAAIPVVGPVIFDQSPLVYLLYLIVPLTFFVVFRTPFGLRLRATGEVPEAVDTAGVSVARMRYYGVALSGVLAAFGGAYLSISLLSAFTENMTNGRGFIALAALIFGRWNPIGATAAALLFGFAQAVTLRISQGAIPSEFLNMIPYILTIVVLAGAGGRAIAPAAVGKPYRKE
jgi:simple sugar transport system permease protein